jgi:putative copper export protein
MAVKKGQIVVALAAAAVVLLYAGVPASRLLTWALVLACPLMMLFMHHGGRAGHGAHDDGHSEPREQALRKND